MPAELKRGMDHSIYPFSPMPERRKLRWPGEKPLAVCFVLYLDYWELETPPGHRKPPDVQGMWGHQFPDLRTYSYRLYGERIGVFRILDTLRKYGLKVTVAAGAEICRRYPSLIQRCLEDGHEIAAHGTHATRMISSQMTEADESAYISESIEAVTRCAGTRPVGWFSQYQNESTRTLALVANEGIRYVGDWSNDEQPYRFTIGQNLVSLPLQTELDDMQVLWMRQRAPWTYPVLIGEAANQLVMDGRDNARTLVLGLRSWLSGRPHHIRYLDEALWDLARRTDTWVTTAASVVESFIEQEAKETP